MIGAPPFIAMGLIFALGNALRGGWGSIPFGKGIYIAAHVVMLFIACGLPMAIAAGVGARIGAAFGWGQYIGTYLNGKYETGKPEPEVGFIDWLIQPLSGSPIKYALAGMAMRGLLWAACSFLVLFLTWAALSVVHFNMALPQYFWIGPLGYAFMPLGFIISKKFASPSNAWAVGEGINGAICGWIWWRACV